MRGRAIRRAQEERRLGQCLRLAKTWGFSDKSELQLWARKMRSTRRKCSCYMCSGKEKGRREIIDQLRVKDFKEAI